MSTSGPYSGYSLFQLPNQPAASLSDVTILGHQADGNTYSITLAELATLLGSGGGFTFSYNANLTALGIYNFGQYTNTPNNIASSNATAMTAMLGAMTTGPAGGIQGGECWIPQFTYLITPGNFNVPNGANMHGLGTGGNGGGSGGYVAYHFQVQGDGTLFNCAGSHNIGGSHFSELAFGYSSSAPALLGTSTAIYAGGENIRAFRCTFANYPTAMICDSLSNGLTECTMFYSSGPNGVAPNNVGRFAAVYLQSPECYAVGPGEFFQAAQGGGGSPPSNTSCIAIAGNSENAVVRELHIQHWSYGIDFCIAPALGEGSNPITWPKVIGCEVASWITAVYLQPYTILSGGSAGTTGTIYGAKFQSCTFLIDQNATSMTPVVLIDASGTLNNTVAAGNGTNANISDVEFNNCSVFAGNQYGYQIQNVANLRIIGGMSSGNGNTSTNGGNPGAGIAITGACGNVLVKGCNLNPKFPGSSSPSRAQTFGILITGSPTSNVTFEGCDMSASGYATTPTNGGPDCVQVTGSPTDLHIINCAGYNDQNFNIIGSGTLAINTNYMAATLHSTPGGTGTVNYYGPSLLEFTAVAGTYKINGGTAITPTTGQSVTLTLDPYDTISFQTNAPTAYQWYGN